MSEIHHYSNGKVVLYLRERSPKWQARFKLPERKGWFRISTGEENLEIASQVAIDKFDEMRFRLKEGKPPVTNKFKSIAEIAISDMETEIRLGVSKPTYKTYIQNIKRYSIPFFGPKNIDSIDYRVILQFEEFCFEKAGKILSATTVNHINVGLRRIFKTALKLGYIQPQQIPELKNDGIASKKRPTFTEKEWKIITRNLRDWHKKPARNDREILHRKFLRAFVLFCGSSGLRPGTEMKNLKWIDVDENWTYHGKKYVKITVRVGKTIKHTGARDVIAMPGLKTYLEYIREINPNQEPNDFVFRLPDKTYPSHIDHTFAVFLKGLGLQEGQGGKRTLFSTRSFYITQRLLNGVSIHVVARNCGTSTNMIERYYSKVISTLAADQLTGYWKPPKEMEPDIS